MKSWKTPTDDDILKTVALLRQEQHYRRFFEGLQNPRWIKPLRARGYFAEPPAPVYNEKEGTVRYPPWPESRYLARMAVHDPDTVIGVLNSIPDNGNPLVYEDLVDAALNVSAVKATWIVDRVESWFDSAIQFQLPTKLGKLMSKFAEEDETSSAFRLAKILLAVSPAHGRTRETLYSVPGVNAQLTIDCHDYEEIVCKYLPSLIARAPEETLRLLCDLLASTVASSGFAADGLVGDDGSYLWCPSVEDAGPDGHGDLLTLLTAFVRDAAAMSAKTRDCNVREIITIFDSKQYHIFERLGYHLLRRFPDGVMDLVTQRLTDPARFNVFETRYEYERLAEECFARLPPDDQSKMLNWIEIGPDATIAAHSPQESSDKGLALTDLKEYSECWRRDRLSPIAHALPIDWKERYEGLVERFGEAGRSPFRPTSGVRWVSRGSPITAEELSSKALDEIVQYLRSWRQTDQFEGPSYEGLVNALTNAVSIDPWKFLQGWQSFQALSQRYFYALLAGFREALKVNWRNEWWETVLTACQWAGEKALEVASLETQQKGPLEPTWTWVAKRIIELLAAGFEDGDHTIPRENRNLAWRVLEPLTWHPEALPEFAMAESGRSGVDYSTASLNCIRGLAMHASIRYALWLRRHWEQSTGQVQLIKRGFDAMPEVRELLSDHLDSARDASLATRAVYGQWFPWICLLDNRWAQDHTRAIFPEETEQEASWRAAWFSYIIYCPPYGDVFKVLRSCYAMAVARLRPYVKERDWLRDPGRKLAEHLMIYYGRGLMPVCDNLLQEFFCYAPPPIRGYAIEFVGNSLAREAGRVPQDVLDRFRRLWQTRCATATVSTKDRSRDPELVAFGSWFSSGRFDPVWSLIQLRNSLIVAGWSEPEKEVVDELVQHAAGEPAIALECVRHLIDGDKQGWAIHRWHNSFADIFRIALKAKDHSVIATARRLINRLGERGFSEFGRLL